MNAQLPWKWYIKPVLPIVLAGSGLLAVFLFFMPDPLWSLQLYGGDNRNGPFYCMITLIFWLAVQVALWASLGRAWKFHGSMGVPAARHFVMLVLTSLGSILAVWLTGAIIVFAGLRSGFQDHDENPWFPLLARSEHPVVWSWLTLSMLIWLGIFGLWFRWSAGYGDRFFTLFFFLVSLFWAAAFFLLPISWIYTAVFLICYALFVIAPLPRQLSDMEVL